MFCIKCGHQLDDNQKFCHKCGTAVPLAQQQPQQAAQQPMGYAPQASMPANMTIPVEGSAYPVAINNGGQPIETVNAEVIPAAYQNGGYPMQQQAYGQQPVQQQMPQININLEQKQETTIINNRSSEDSGWLWGEIGIIGIGVWIASTWWIALITCIVLGLLVMVPFIGHIICVVLGAGVGLISGILSKAFGAPNWVSIGLGILIGVVAIGINFDDRKAMTED